MNNIILKNNKKIKCQMCKILNIEYNNKRICIRCCNINKRYFPEKNYNYYLN